MREDTQHRECVCVCVCVCVLTIPALWRRVGVGLCFSLSLLVFLCHRPLLAKDAHSLFFLSKVEAVIHPRFLAELFSPDPQLDLVALAEELEQEEGLTPEEVSQGRERDT